MRLSHDYHGTVGGEVLRLRGRVDVPFGGGGRGFTLFGQVAKMGKFLSSFLPKLPFAPRRANEKHRLGVEMTTTTTTTTTTKADLLRTERRAVGSSLLLGPVRV